VTSANASDAHGALLNVVLGAAYATRAALALRR